MKHNRFSALFTDISTCIVPFSHDISNTLNIARIFVQNFIPERRGFDRTKISIGFRRWLGPFVDWRRVSTPGSRVS